MKKQNTRRKFITTGLKAGITLPLLGSQLFSCNAEGERSGGNSENKKLKILILGGTSFLGPHQVAYALGRGHSVSTFTRGKTMPTFRDLKTTMKDTHDWWYSDALTDERRNKFEKKADSVLMREKEILDAWKVMAG